MFNISSRPGWQVSERLVTPEKVFLNRRRFLKELGLAGIAASPLLSQAHAEESSQLPPSARKHPPRRNPEFNPDWKLTDEKVAANYINFFEFTTAKDKVTQMTGKFITAPWPIEIGGRVEKPLKIDAEELIDQMDLEERIYRFRCVEAWAMVVPWSGFPLSKLIEKVKPKPEAKFVRFETFNRPDQAPGMKRLANYPWPYTEGLRIDEALNPLTMVVTGIYGKPLPKQHGAPIRIIVPWKYGYKSIKSIVKIDFVEKQPATLWETLAPHEYPFESNVDPTIAHPRWSQATERMIDTGQRVRTQPFNGYGDHVAHLYKRR